MFRSPIHRPRWAAASIAAIVIVSMITLPGSAQAANRAAAAQFTATGLVRDGSGHGWPLYARIAVEGVGVTFTDPATGRYEIALNDGASYVLNVTAVYPGYLPAQEKVEIAGADVSKDVVLTVDTAACGAPGYAERLTGVSETFDAPTTPPGWSVVNNTTGGGWGFTDDGSRGNLTGGSGGFAMIDSDHLGVGKSQDSELRSPILDFTGVDEPVLRFNSDFRSFTNSFGDLDLSVDSGQTWTTLQHNVDNARGPRVVSVPLTAASNLATVVLRWRYVGSFGWWWEVDNFFAGKRSCDPVHGGLVVGQTLDANTQQGLNDTKVVSNDKPTDTATSAATPDDPNLGDGFYWMFSSLTGSHPFTASHGGYVSATRTVNVATDWATRADFTLGAGKITVTPAAIAKTVKMGNTASATITVKNTGQAPATVTVGERDNGFTTMLKQGTGAPVNLVRGSYSRHQLTKGAEAAPPAPKPYAPPWTDVANYPTEIMDNAAAANQGKVYSVGGTDGADVLGSGFVFDPAAGAWSPIAAMPTPRQRPAAAFLQDKLYVVGGWDVDGDPAAALEIYNPVTNSWSTGASTPAAFSASGVAVLGGKMYVVGGCDTNVCGHTEVLVYDPAANSWSEAADYPLDTSWLACGGVLGRVYCAGGTNDTVDTKKGFGYNPATNAWTAIADLPIDLWAMAYVGTSDALVVSGGVTDNASTLTNQGFAYSPGSDSWVATANSNNTVYRAGSACGFYKVGGSVGQFNAVDKAEVLPGFDDCGSATDVPWLTVTPTSFTINPGATVKLAVTLDASSIAVVSQPGDYAATITYSTNTPYPVTGTPVTMTVTPPSSWGKITGTVTGAGCSGPVPLAGAVVQIDSWAAHYSLITDASGNYAFWLDRRNNPLTVIAAKDGWQPQVRTIKITAGATTTANWTLAPVKAC